MHKKKKNGREPWCSGYGRRPMFRMSLVWIPAPNTGLTFLHKSFVKLGSVRLGMANFKKLISLQPSLVVVKTSLFISLGQPVLCLRQIWKSNFWLRLCHHSRRPKGHSSHQSERQSGSRQEANISLTRKFGFKPKITKYIVIFTMAEAMNKNSSMT